MGFREPAPARRPGSAVPANADACVSDLANSRPFCCSMGKPHPSWSRFRMITRLKPGIKSGITTGDGGRAARKRRRAGRRSDGRRDAGTTVGASSRRAGMDGGRTGRRSGTTTRRSGRRTGMGRGTLGCLRFDGRCPQPRVSDCGHYVSCLCSAAGTRA